MSRTIRRKNYEETQNTSWDRVGKKIGGRYVVEEYFRWSDDHYYHWSKDFIRPMTKEERIDHDKRIYRDRKRYGVPHWYVNLYFEKPLRQHNKREIQKYFRNEDYEPMCLVKTRDALRDWT